MDNQDNEILINNVEDIILLINKSEKDINNLNNEYKKKIDKYKEMMESIIFDYHSICKKIYKL